IGEDAAVLEPGEALNETAMYSIYAIGDSAVLDDDEDASIGLNEAEELLRQLRTDDPAEYERIANLRNGIRAGRHSATKGRVVYCQAGQYQQLLLLDAHGAIVTRDIATVLGVLRATPDEIGLPVDPAHNHAVAAAKSAFAREAWQRQVEQEQTESLSAAQRVVLRELRTAFAQTTDVDMRAQISVLEAAFRGPLSRAVQSELQALRRANLADMPLVEELSHLYTRYGLDQQRQPAARDDAPAAPVIVCSAALV
ncbi:MAG: helicase, partial [Chloroflexales bacterium]|nr:helicase [Chloroflexales bacterium]